MAKVKVRRASREELPGMALLRDSIISELPYYPKGSAMLDLDMEVDPVLTHLRAHDPEGFMTAVLKDETLGFGSAHVRSRQCILSELWVLPQHRGQGAGEALLSRLLAYGDRSGAREFVAVAPPDGAVQSLLLRHAFQPLCPVYLMSLNAEAARELASTLARLLAGQEVTSELFNQRGQADLDRIDRLTRLMTREVDHLFWLKTLRHRAAFVRQGSRIAAYAYGGADAVGPVAGSTQDAALAGVGWALSMALEAGIRAPLNLWVPARFVPAVEALAEAGAQITATHLCYVRDCKLSLDRSLLAAPGLP